MLIIILLKSYTHLGGLVKGIQKALSVYTWSLAKGRYGVELIFPMGGTMLCDVFNSTFHALPI